MNAMDELDLLQRAVAGDGDALTALLRDAAPRVRAWLAGRIPEPMRPAFDVDDVMQVTYLEAFLRVSSVEHHSGQAFGDWLRQLAQRNIDDAVHALELGDHAPHQEQDAIGDPHEAAHALYNRLGAASIDPQGRDALREFHDAIHQALDVLPEDYARALRLFELERCGVAEVARKMGRSEGAVFMLRARALDRLRELFAITATGAPSHTPGRGDLP